RRGKRSKDDTLRVCAASQRCSPHPYSESGDVLGAPESATAALACLGVGGKQLPAPLGDDFDGTVDDFDGGLVVDRIRRPRQAGGSPFGSGHSVCPQAGLEPPIAYRPQASFPNSLSLSRSGGVRRDAKTRVGGG